MPPPRSAWSAFKYSLKDEHDGRPDHICLMATYNDWMNAKVYEAARSLTDVELSVDRKAFFGSILGRFDISLPPKASTNYCS